MEFGNMLCEAGNIQQRPRGNNEIIHNRWKKY